MCNFVRRFAVLGGSLTGFAPFRCTILKDLIKMTNEQRNSNLHALRELMSKRIVVLDGGLGTMIQAQHLKEEDFHYAPLTGTDAEMAGCNDILPLSRRDVIASIHRAYLEAGADIVETDSFNCNSLSLADYGLQEYGYELSVAVVEVAR